MDELRVGDALESQVVARHTTAAEELAGLSGIPDPGSGPGTLALLRIFAAVLQTTGELALANDLTAGSVREAVDGLRGSDEAVRRLMRELAGGA